MGQEPYTPDKQKSYESQECKWKGTSSKYDYGKNSTSEGASNPCPEGARPNTTWRQNPRYIVSHRTTMYYFLMEEILHTIQAHASWVHTNVRSYTIRFKIATFEQIDQNDWSALVDNKSSEQNLLTVLIDLCWYGFVNVHSHSTTDLFFLDHFRAKRIVILLQGDR